MFVFLLTVNYTIKCNSREKKRSSYKSVVKFFAFKLSATYRPMATRKRKL